MIASFQTLIKKSILDAYDLESNRNQDKAIDQSIYPVSCIAFFRFR